MRFEELSKKHQDFLMYCLSDYIKGKIRKGTISKLRGVKALPLAKVPVTTRLLSKLANEINKDFTGKNTCEVLFLLAQN